MRENIFETGLGKRLFFRWNTKAVIYNRKMDKKDVGSPTLLTWTFSFSSSRPFTPITAKTSASFQGDLLHLL